MATRLRHLVQAIVLGGIVVLMAGTSAGLFDNASIRRALAQALTATPTTVLGQLDGASSPAAEASPTPDEAPNALRGADNGDNGSDNGADDNGADNGDDNADNGSDNGSDNSSDDNGADNGSDDNGADNAVDNESADNGGDNAGDNSADNAGGDNNADNSGDNVSPPPPPSTQVRTASIELKGKVNKKKSKILAVVAVEDEFDAPVPRADLTLTVMFPNAAQSVLTARTGDGGRRKIKLKGSGPGTYTFHVDDIDSQGRTFTPTAADTASITI